MPDVPVRHLQVQLSSVSFELNPAGYFEKGRYIINRVPKMEVIKPAMAEAEA